MIVKKIKRNAIRCKNCGEELVSKQRNKIVKCSCGQCSVDGGVFYLKRTGEYEELVEMEEVEVPD